MELEKLSELKFTSDLKSYIKSEFKWKHILSFTGRGFYAYVSKDMANPGSGHTIIYDVVMTNYGGGYNGHTGVYTVPIDGLYSFTWITRVSCKNDYTSELHVNNKIAGSVFIYCWKNSNAGYAVIEVRKGDSVFVRTLTGSGMIRSNTYGRTSFSGFLVS